MNEPPRRTERQRHGDRAEQAACALLESAGLVCIARNVRYPFGEIDLVMRDQRELVFVEVRARASTRFGGAAASVDFRKRRRLQRAAQRFLQARYGGGTWPPCRFDVVAIDEGRPDWIRAAFDAG